MQEAADVGDTAGWARLAGDRPTRTSPAALVLIWLGGAMTSTLFLGEQPTAADRSQSAGLYRGRSGVMLPMASAEAGRGVRRNGSTAAGWLGVNGTQNPMRAARSVIARSK